MLLGLSVHIRGGLELEFVSSDDGMVNRDQIFFLVAKEFVQHTGNMF